MPDTVADSAARQLLAHFADRPGDGHADQHAAAGNQQQMDERMSKRKYTGYHGSHGKLKSHQPGCIIDETLPAQHGGHAQRQLEPFGDGADSDRIGG